jgi:hypothetical protein
MNKSPSTPKLTALNFTSLGSSQASFAPQSGVAMLNSTQSASRFSKTTTSTSNNFFDGQMPSHISPRQINMQRNTYAVQMQPAIHNRPTSPRVPENRFNNNISNQYNFPPHMATSHLESRSTTTPSSPYTPSMMNSVTDQETQEFAMELPEGSPDEHGISNILRTYQEEYQRILETCLPKIQETFQKLLEMKRSFKLKLEETASHTQTIKKRKRETLQGIEELR